MTSVNQMMARYQYTKPVRPENRVVKVTKQHDGSLTCVQASGNAFAIPASEIEMQAFVVFTMAHGHEL